MGSSRELPTDIKHIKIYGALNMYIDIYAAHK